MIVTTRFPDLPPRPETSANAVFRRSFAARWGRENVVFMATARHVQTPTLPSALSFKLVESGTATIRVGRRSLLLEPGLGLVVNEGEPYAVTIASEVPVRCFSVHFRPGLAQDVAAARRCNWDQALARGTAAALHRAPLLREHLRALTPQAWPVLQAIREHTLAGEADGEIYEPLFIELIAHLLAQDEGERARHLALQAVRPANREELVRRAGWAHDFIHSHYADPITLDQIAEAARLSKFHLLRAFRHVYGDTPHAMLQARRAAVAASLLRGDAADLVAVAGAAGFGSRWTMQRALRRYCGATASALQQAGSR